LATPEKEITQMQENNEFRLAAITPNAGHWVGFGRIHGPRWKDLCGHGGYVGTFENVERPGDGVEIIDLYVFEHPRDGIQDFCLRYGPEDPDYYSPGDIYGVIQAAEHLQRYRNAVRMLRALGRIKWEPKQ
jgi:hypothetical protein